MILKFLPFVIPTIFFIGWAIALVQANRIKNDIPKLLHAGINSIFTGGLILYFMAFVGSNFNFPTNNIGSLGFACLSFASIALTTYYAIKKETSSIIIFALYGTWSIYLLIRSLA